MKKTPLLNLISWLEESIKKFGNRSSPEYNPGRAVSFVLVKRKILGSFLREEKEMIENVIFDASTSNSQEDFEYFLEEAGIDYPADIKDYYIWVQDQAKEYTEKIYQFTGYTNQLLNKKEKIKKIKEENKKESQLLLGYNSTV